MGLAVSRAALPTALAALFVVSGLCGCDDEERLPTHPVTGEVFINEIPASGCVVTFVPADPALKGVVMPAATVDEFGIFRLTTYETGDGAPEGDYGVTLRWEATDWPDKDKGVDPVVTMRPRPAARSVRQPGQVRPEGDRRSRRKRA